ncbi:MAG: hypothetical protein AABX38_06325 [Candidatus Micrarchaeota archaeon]
MVLRQVGEGEDLTVNKPSFKLANANEQVLKQKIAFVSKALGELNGVSKPVQELRSQLENALAFYKKGNIQKADEITKSAIEKTAALRVEMQAGINSAAITRVTQNAQGYIDQATKMKSATSNPASIALLDKIIKDAQGQVAQVRDKGFDKTKDEYVLHTTAWSVAIAAISKSTEVENIALQVQGSERWSGILSSVERRKREDYFKGVSIDFRMVADHALDYVPDASKDLEQRITKAFTNLAYGFSRDEKILENGMGGINLEQVCKIQAQYLIALAKGKEIGTSLANQIESANKTFERVKDTHLLVDSEKDRAVLYQATLSTFENFQTARSAKTNVEREDNASLWKTNGEAIDIRLAREIKASEAYRSLKSATTTVLSMAFPVYGLATSAEGLAAQYDTTGKVRAIDVALFGAGLATPGIGKLANLGIKGAKTLEGVVGVGSLAAGTVVGLKDAVEAYEAGHGFDAIIGAFSTLQPLGHPARAAFKTATSEGAKGVYKKVGGKLKAVAGDERGSATLGAVFEPTVIEPTLRPDAATSNEPRLSASVKDKAKPILLTRSEFEKRVGSLPEELQKRMREHFTRPPDTIAFENALIIFDLRKQEVTGSFRDMIKSESMDGNARSDRLAVNGYYDPQTGKILAFGNPQSLSSQIIEKGKPFTILLDIRESGKIIEVIGAPKMAGLEGLKVTEGLNPFLRKIRGIPEPEQTIVDTPKRNIEEPTKAPVLHVVEEVKVNLIVGIFAPEVRLREFKKFLELSPEQQQTEVAKLRKSGNEIGARKLETYISNFGKMIKLADEHGVSRSELIGMYEDVGVVSSEKIRQKSKFDDATRDTAAPEGKVIELTAHERLSYEFADDYKKASNNVEKVALLRKFLELPVEERTAILAELDKRQEIMTASLLAADGQTYLKLEKIAAKVGISEIEFVEFYEDYMGKGITENFHKLIEGKLGFKIIAGEESTSKILDFSTNGKLSDHVSTGAIEGIPAQSRIESIASLGGLTGAYEIKIITPEGKIKSLFLKTMDLTADELGSIGAKTAGIPAPKVITKAGGKALEFTSEGRKTKYGLMESMQDFEGSLVLEGKKIQVKTASASNITSMHDEPILKYILEEHPDLFWQEMGYAQTGSLASGLWDGHELNLWAMMLEVSPSDATFLESKGRTTFTDATGRKMIFKFGRIDLDSAGHFQSVKQYDGSHDFSAMVKWSAKGDMHRIFDRIAKTTNSSIPQVMAFATEHIKEGAKKWYDSIGKTGSFASGMARKFQEHDGKPVSIGLEKILTPEQKALIEAGEKVYRDEVEINNANFGMPINGNPRTSVDYVDGRTKFVAREGVEAFYQFLGRISKGSGGQLWNDILSKVPQHLIEED